MPAPTAASTHHADVEAIRRSAATGAERCAGEFPGAAASSNASLAVLQVLNRANPGTMLTIR